mgnify:CR=1 FL=1
MPRFDGRAAPFTFSDFPHDSLTDLRRHYASAISADVRVGGAGASEQLVTLAVDVNAERGVLTNRMAGSVVRASRNNLGWTAQHQWFGARASLSSGLRVEQNDSFGTAVAPRVPLRLHWRRRTRS